MTKLLIERHTNEGCRRCETRGGCPATCVINNNWPMTSQGYWDISKIFIERLPKCLAAEVATKALEQNKADVDELVKAAREILACPVVFEDERIKYKEMQICRVDLENLESAPSKFKEPIGLFADQNGE